MVSPITVCLGPTPSARRFYHLLFLLAGLAIVAYGCGKDTRPSALGVYAVEGTELRLIEPTNNLKAAGALGLFWHGIDQLPVVNLVDSTCYFYYFQTDAPANAGDLTLSRLEFAREMKMNGLAGERWVPIDLFLPVEEIPVSIIPDAKENRLFKVAPMSPLGRGIYALHLGTISAPYPGGAVEEPFYFSVASRGLEDLASDPKTFAFDWSIPEQAREALSNLDTEISVHYFVTSPGNLPLTARWMPRDVETMLDAYRKASGGKISFTVSDPHGTPGGEESLRSSGLHPIQIQNDGGLSSIWSVITIAGGGFRDAKTALLTPTQLGDLDRLLLNCIRPGTRIVIYTPSTDGAPKAERLGGPTQSGRYSSLEQLLTEEGFQVSRTDLTTTSPVSSDVKLLLVVEPTNLSPEQACTIAHTLHVGIPVGLAIQARSYDYVPIEPSGWDIFAEPIQSGLDDLLRSWGLSIRMEHLLDAHSATIACPRPTVLNGLRMQNLENVNLPLHILIDETDLKRSRVFDEDAKAVAFLWGSAIDMDRPVLDGLNLTERTIIASSERSWLRKFVPGRVAPDILDPDSGGGTGRYPLAVLIEGIFDDPEGCPSSELAGQPSRLLVLGGAFPFMDMSLGATLPLVEDLITFLAR